MVIAFSKWQGAGNDFIIIQDFDQVFPAANKVFISKLCHRQFGIGADGLLLIQKGRQASLRMRYFNADGQEVAMCGNGLRCFFKYCVVKGFCLSKDAVETLKAVHHCELKDNKVLVSMGKPLLIAEGLTGEEFEKGDFVEVGVPHLVIFEENIEEKDVGTSGKAIRNSPYFMKDGVNVNFVKRLSKDALYVRTYERGVEAETLSCGTGAIASAFVASKRFNMAQKIEIRASSDITLEVVISSKDECMLVGPAEFVFDGIYPYSF